jgi:hypothetical protein
MSSPFGGVRRREDPAVTAADRRTRQHLARDINDTRALADAGRPPGRRGRPWLLLAAATGGLAVVAIASSSRGAADVPVTVNCDVPAVAVASSQIDAGTPLRFRLTGPDDVRYVVTLDGAAVQGDADVATTYTPTPAGPALELDQCVSPTLTVPAPGGSGAHRLALLAVDDDGAPRQVTAVTVTVNG